MNPRVLRPGRLILLLAGGAFLVALARLGTLDRAGPPHADVMLDGGIPATLYVPGSNASGGFIALPEPPPPDRRAPAVLLAHGFSSDRVMVSTLARRLAANGYAVLAIDFRGHGANRNPFPPNWGRPDALQPDLVSALAFLRDSPYVDPARIVVMGHSMGAGAVVDYATREAGLAGVVAISGGWQLAGPRRPPNVLFIYATGDPDRIRESASGLAARLAGVDHAEVGRLYGAFADGHAVRTIEVAREDHVTILWSEVAAREILAWLDAVCGVSRSAPVTLDDPRRPAAGLAVLLAIVLLAGIGYAIGRLAPLPPPQRDGRGFAGLARLLVALLATLPLLATGSPFTFLGLEVGDLTIAHLGIAGLGWLVGLAIAGRLDGAWRPVLGRSIATGLVAFVAVYVVFVPVTVTFHRLTPTPERLVSQIVATALLLPFLLAFELDIRRGGAVRSSLLALAGRAITLGCTVFGVRAGVLPGVVMLMLPTFGILFVLFEVVAIAAYRTSRNVVAIAALEAAWLAWSAAATMPIRW
jgi:dienelactone hydrolase